MPKPTVVEQYEDALQRLRSDVVACEEAMSLVLQTARTADLRDGLASRGSGPSPTGEDADVVLTTVEAAAIRRDPVDRERKQALEILASVLGAERMLSRAADLSRVLRDRIPAESRQIAEVTCVDERCENLRAEGWDDAHPNGKVGRCRPCYERRLRSRRNG